jgi:arsenate reductase
MQRFTTQATHDLIQPMTTLNVLFLCTHNSARSILSEALLNHMASGAGGTRFKAYSAGSSPRENQQPNPLGIQVLQAAGIDTSYLRSKSWDEFAQPNAPHMDLVITVCDNAAGAMPTPRPCKARTRSACMRFATPCI